MQGYDMSEHWRLVSIEGRRVSGTFWVSLSKPGKQAWVRTVDVLVWDEGRSSGRVLHSGDLTGSVKNGRPDLSKHMVNSDKLADVEEVWDEMLEALATAVAVASPTPDAGGVPDTKDGETGE